MSFDAKSIENKTGTMSALAQILTGLGIVGVILGSVAMLFGLATEFAGMESDNSLYGVEGAIAGITMLLWGLAMSAAGATLHAVRSIAVNCARMAESSD